MRRAVVQLLQQQRQRVDSELSSATENAVSTLAFLAQLYIGSLARSSKHFAELAGRSKANALDVAQSLEENQVNFKELMAFAQDTIDDPKLTSQSAQDLVAGIEDPVFYEYADLPDGYEYTESLGLSEYSDSETVDPLPDSKIFPTPTPQELLVNRIPLPIVDDALKSPDKTQPQHTAPLASEDTNLVEATPIINVPAIETADKTAPEEGTEVWRALLKRRRGLCQVEADKNSRPLYAEHDELYRTSYSALKRDDSDCYFPGDQGTLDVGSFASDPPSGNKATINHTIAPYQTPITPLFYNSVLSSFLPKFLTSASQPLRPEEHEQLGQAPLPSWVSVPEPAVVPASQPNPVMRIVAKVASPVGSPATLIKIKLPKKEKEQGSTSKRKPKAKSSEKPSAKSKLSSKPRKPYDMTWKFNSKALLSKAAQRGMSSFTPSSRKLLETPKLTSQVRDATERSTSSNEGLSSPSPDTQPDFPSGSHDEWHNGTCVDDRPKITLKFKVPSPKDATPKVVLRLPPHVAIDEEFPEDPRPPQDLKRGYDELAPSAINCFCPEYDIDHGTMMVSCDRCEQWFHGTCVRILTKEDLPDSWFCDRCVHRTAKTKNQKRPKHRHPASDADEFFNRPTSPRSQMLKPKW
ncbi:hypothetical protein DSO57_1000478 [Entomophthora muscae]|nr:hypothetical protein DSO57_1000478 [Entomophthora muscae]